MNLLTFLGAGRYDTTTYTWDTQQATTRFAPVAACRFLHPQRITVFLTDDARSKVFSDLVQELPSNIEVIDVNIPLGSTESELWQIFNCINEQVKAGETVAFDITHGLRSFPLLGVLAAIFLRSGLDVRIEALLYGGYDVRDRQTNLTPMFDLTPMLTLLEWSIAADRFNRTGDSRYIASLIRQQRKSLAVLAQNNQNQLAEVGKLGHLAGCLEEISQSLHLIRPNKAMQSVAGLSDRIGQARAMMERSSPLQPFFTLLERIVKSYAPLQNPYPEDPLHLVETLHIERQMIHLYIERELWVQAVSLAREWLLSWVMVQIGLPNITRLNARQSTESILGSESNEFVKSKQQHKPYQPTFLNRIPELERVLSLWPNLTDVRNDILHAAQRDDPKDPKELIEQIKNLVNVLDSLPLESAV